MNLLRVIVVAAAALLLAGGYLSSQVAFVASTNPLSRNATSEYAANIDTPVIRIVALLILVACVVLVVVQKPTEDAD